MSATPESGSHLFYQSGLRRPRIDRADAIAALISAEPCPHSIVLPDRSRPA